jgi:hypothetical protein
MNMTQTLVTKGLNMKLLKFAIVPAVALILAGCVVTSVYPFYTQKDLVFEPGLVGHWIKVEDKNESWKFTKAATNAYQLTQTSEGQTNVMQAHLFKLRGQMFLDLFAPDQDVGGCPPAIPSHLLLRVFELSPKVRLAPINHQWLGDLLDKDPKAVKNQILQTGAKPDDRRVVLTAETVELQAFVIKHLKTEEAWKDAFELEPTSTRVEATTPTGR